MSFYILFGNGSSNFNDINRRFLIPIQYWKNQRSTKWKESTFSFCWALRAATFVISSFLSKESLLPLISVSENVIMAALWRNSISWPQTNRWMENNRRSVKQWNTAFTVTAKKLEHNLNGEFFTGILNPRNVWVLFRFCSNSRLLTICVNENIEDDRGNKFKRMILFGRRKYLCIGKQWCHQYLKSYASVRISELYSSS